MTTPCVVGHSAAATSSSGTVTHRVNGDRGRGILTTLDGIDISDPIIPRGELTNAPVNPDMVQEFRVTTALPRAEYGRNAGAQIEMVTRSGGNEFHGGLYEFFRNTNLDANAFFNNSSGVARELLQQNQFGASLGGPILHNKLFFFFNYEGTRRNQSLSRTSTAFTDLARQGIFRFVKGTVTADGKTFTALSTSLVDSTTGALKSGVSVCATATQTNCIATYNIPEIGKPLAIKVSLPGGYEFEALAVVRWTRDSPQSGADAPPGYGAQFTQISPEARQLVYRYVRNREPLFHDDL